MTNTWKTGILTLFPDMFPGPLQHSLAGKALEKQIWSLETFNIRDFSQDKHLKVDDTSYGGGEGLVIRPDVVHDALLAAEKSVGSSEDVQFIYTSPRGKPFNQDMAKQWISSKKGLVILCGRYEGIDQRVIDYWTEEKKLIEVSLGDFVLSGGEIAALTMLDACIRLLPGVLKNEKTATIESFELDLLEFSQYTKPCVWQNRVVPEVLRSGDHKKIAAWQQNSAETITKERRPDLWSKYLKRTNKENC